MKRPKDFAIPPGAKSLEIVLPWIHAGDANKPRVRPATKHGNVPTVFEGIRYDSAAEAERAKHWAGMRPVGVVVVRQPTFRLGVPENVYRPDFLVLLPESKAGIFLRTFNAFAEDVKGHETIQFRKNRKLWREYGPLPLQIVKGDKVVETIIPKHFED